MKIDVEWTRGRFLTIQPNGRMRSLHFRAKRRDMCVAGGRDEGRKAQVWSLYRFDGAGPRRAFRR